MFQVASIWSTHLKGSQIRTTFGREFSFGPYISANQQHLYTLHHFRQSVPPGIFYNDQSMNTSHRIIGVSSGPIAQASGSESQPPKEPEWPKTLLPPPTTANLHWYYSEASLSGVAIMSICREQASDRPLGALITYTNKTTAIIGQWRRNFTNLKKYVIATGCVLHWTQHDTDTTDLWITEGMQSQGSHSTKLSGTLVWYFSLSGSSVITHVP
jgi:hypothetical protein